MPRWGCPHFRTVTQGRRCAPTLGWRPQSLWDCQERAVHGASSSGPHPRRDQSRAFILAALRRRERRAPDRGSVTRSSAGWNSSFRTNSTRSLRKTMLRLTEPRSDWGFVHGPVSPRHYRKSACISPPICLTISQSSNRMFSKLHSILGTACGHGS